MYKIDNCWEYTVYHRELSSIPWDVPNAREIQGERIYVYVCLIIFSMELKLTQHCKAKYCKKYLLPLTLNCDCISTFI